MRIYISVDMEGISGVNGDDQTAAGRPEYGRARKLMAEDANADREKLVEYVSARFDSIELAARWLAGPEQERAQKMVDKLLRWLAVNPRRQTKCLRRAPGAVGDAERREQ